MRGLIALALLFFPVFAQAAAPEKGTGYPYAFRDDLNRTVTLPAQPRRIVSIGPSNTEILFAIGAGNLVVGIDRFSVYPPETKNLPKIGGLTDPSIDKILALKPDLVLVVDLAAKDLDRFASLGLRTAYINAENIEGVYRSIELVGRMTNRNAQAKNVVAAMKKRLRAVRDAVSTAPKTARPRVFCELGTDPIFTAGPGSFVDDLIAAAGGANIARDANAPWIPYSVEALIERDPEVILVMRPENLREILDGSRSQWATLTAVRQKRVHLVNADEMTHPSPRMVRAIETMARLFYPNLFPAKAPKR